MRARGFDAGPRVPEGAAHRICNGAVDNASGVAMMIEIAGRLAGQPRPARDILFLATTSEEKGLLGAEYFATHPAVPIRSIVAAINMDTVAIAPAGAPVAEIGRGFPPLDSIISQTIVAAGRNIDGDDDVESLAQRQDGWALARAGVPSVMIGGGLGDPARLGAFLRDVYHSPADQVGRLQPEPRGVGPVHELEPIVRIAVRDQDRSAVGDESQLPLSPPRGFLGCEPEGDVAVDFEHDLFAACSIQGPA